MKENLSKSTIIPIFLIMKENLSKSTIIPIFQPGFIAKDEGCRYEDHSMLAFKRKIITMNSKYEFNKSTSTLKWLVYGTSW